MLNPNNNFIFEALAFTRIPRSRYNVVGLVVFVFVSLLLLLPCFGE